jgi:hypothetical protein
MNTSAQPVRASSAATKTLRLTNEQLIALKRDVLHVTRFPFRILSTSFLLDFAERWITLDVPAAAQCSERTYGRASRVRARAFDFVSGHQQLPVRVQNIS